MNVCLQDAVNNTNGNTSGICDSTGEPAIVYWYYQVTVGDGSHSVTWKVQPDLYAHVIMAGGSQSAVFQEGGSDIECDAAQNSGCQVNNFSVTNGLSALYNTGSTTGYRKLKGMWFKSIHGGTLASGNVCQIQAGYDGSTWQDMQCIDDATSNVSNGTAAVVGGNTFCCHSNFINDWFDSEWGQTALSIVAPHFDQFNAINFHDTTINSHNATATGNPNLLCTDAYNTQTAISFTGTTYMEGQSATMSAPFIQDNGCRALEFTGILEAYPLGGTGSTAPVIEVGSVNGFDTTLNVGAVVEYQGNGTNPWTWPGTVVEQENTTTDCGSPPCAVAVTDSAGNSPGYHSRTSQFNNITAGGNLVVKTLGSTTSPVCPNGSGGALTTSGCTATGTSSTYYAGTTTGSVNVMVGTLSPVPGSLSALLGVPISFTANNSNTTTTPTINLNSLGAETIVKGSSTALSSGDIVTTTPAVVIWNGTNFVLQNPQVNITQSGSVASSFASGQLKTNSVEANSGATTNVTYQGGQNGSSASNLGSGILTGGSNSGAGAAGSAQLEAGPNTGSGVQGFATTIQSFTIAAATTIGYVMEMTTTADRVVAAALGSTNNVGIATSVGGTAAQLYVATEGKILVVFDGTPVVGDYACAPPLSTGTIGLAHDNSLTACPAGQKLGIITGQVSGSGSGATATVLLQLGS